MKIFKKQNCEYVFGLNSFFFKEKLIEYFYYIFENVSKTKRIKTCRIAIKLHFFEVEKIFPGRIKNKN